MRVCHEPGNALRNAVCQLADRIFPLCASFVFALRNAIGGRDVK